jgi:predicted nucleic acid-binding protein
MQDYEKAAEVFNTCRANGVQGSNTDFLICAVSINHQLPIFSVDNDFLSYQKHLPVLFHLL